MMVQPVPLAVRALFLSGAFVLAGVPTARGLHAAGPVWSVGVASIDITPDYPVRLSGFGARQAESEGVRQPIWAKALAIGGDSEGPAVLLAVDNVGISAALVQKLAQRLHERAGIDPARLAVTATHTHSAPMLAGVLPLLFGGKIPDEHQARIEQYTGAFSKKLEEVALAALKNRQPATLEWGIGRVSFARNRRPQGGPVDHDLSMLVVRDRSQSIRALYVNYACHAVTLSDNKISGDWPGYAQEHLERLHPGAVALVSVGCGADSNPNSGVTRDKHEIASQQGHEIAAEVERLLQNPLRPVRGPLVARCEPIELPFDKLPTREEFAKRAKLAGALGYHARVQLDRLDRGEELPAKIAYPIQSWAFGDSLAMVFLPGEVVADYSLRLKRELDGRRLWINAYTNDAPAYIPSEKVLREGGYEGAVAMTYYDKPAPFAAGLEQRIIDTVRRQLDKDFRSPVDLSCDLSGRPLAPEQTLSTMRVRSGLRVDLVAAEPLVASPVAIDFGPDGRLWVAEMADYPQGIDGNLRPGGRIRLLESTRDDGRFDKSAVFLDGIPFPTGVTVWRSGVLVCAAPDILFAEDTNDDGRADVVRKLYSGFGTDNYQARVNSLEYGLDGWVYGSCGLLGGTISSFAGGEPLKLGNRDFRIRPDTGEIEAAAGRSQQGRVRDDWANWFGCTNTSLCRHFPLTENYLKRNPFLAAPQNEVALADNAEENRLYPLSGELQLFRHSGGSGRPTAACGLGIYRDNLLGDEFHGDAFTCEPVNLLVHRMHLRPDGSTFRGVRAAVEAASEFLAATDNWFRPVQVRTGPDGALWVVDMYRSVIEHPRFIPPEVLARLDVRAGFDLGRIYRVRADDRALRKPPRLDRLDTAGLVAALDSSNGWQRDMASQILLWRGDASVAAALEKMAAQHERPETRLHALCVLDGLKALRIETVRKALADDHPGVRRHAIRLIESFLGQDPQAGSDLLALANDSDAQVRLQLACTLGVWHDARCAEVLAALALRADDRFMAAAILSSLRADNAREAASIVLKGWQQDGPPAQLIRQFLGVVVALDDRALADALEQIGCRRAAQLATWQWSAVAGVLDGLERTKRPVTQIADTEAQQALDRFLKEARRLATDEQTPEAERVATILLLGRDTHRFNDDLAQLVPLLTPQQSSAVQQAAAEALGRIPGKTACEALTAEWRAHSPALKNRLLDILLSRAAGQTLLLEKIAAGDIPASDVDAARRQRLLRHPQAKIREQAEKLFAGATSPNRSEVVARYQAALDLVGDRTRGKTVFARACATCHRLENVGHAIGPDLAALANKTPQALLQEILDPNRNLDGRYVAYTAVTKSGRTFSGLLHDETSTSLTLMGPEGKREVLLRADLDELAGSGQSLMPEGLEKDIALQDAADLLSYLTTLGAPSSKATHGK